MKKIVLTFGLISGVIASAMMAITFPVIESIGYGKAELLGYTSIVLSCLLVFFGIRSYRETVGGGRIGFGRGFGVGISIVAVSCLVYVLSFQVIYFKLMPDFAARFEACMVEHVRAKGGDAQAVAAASKQVQEFKRLWDNPVTNAALTFIEPFPIGLIVALVSAAILKKR